VAFFICWAPFHTQRLVSAYANTATAEVENEVKFEVEVGNSTAAAEAAKHVDVEESTQSVGDLAFFYVSGVLYYVSSVINPILYNIMSVKFRQAFAATILRCGCCRRGRGRDDLARSRATLAGDGPTAAAAAACRYHFVGGRRSPERVSSDAGSQPTHRAAADDDDAAQEVRPLTSSLGNGRQVRDVHAADNIVLVDMHVAADASSGSAANCHQTSSARRWFV